MSRQEHEDKIEALCNDMKVIDEYQSPQRAIDIHFKRAQEYVYLRKFDRAFSDLEKIKEIGLENVNKELAYIIEAFYIAVRDAEALLEDNDELEKKLTEYEWA